MIINVNTVDYRDDQIGLKDKIQLYDMYRRSTWNRGPWRLKEKTKNTPKDCQSKMYLAFKIKLETP